jgi:hypothetical protein
MLLASVLTACPPTTASKPTIDTFSASPTTVKASGTDVVLTWTTTGATDVVLSAVPALPVGQAISTGTATVKSVKENTKFTLTAKNAAGDTATKDVSVTLETATAAAPTIVSSVPANDATGIAIDNNTIVVTFDKAMDKTATQGALSGVTSPSFVWSNGDKTVTITSAGLPNTPAATGVNKVVSYSFSNAAKSADGGTLAAVTRKYTTKKAVLLIIDATVTPAATTLSGSAIFTEGTGIPTTLPPCATPCDQNSYEAEIRAGDNNNSVKGDNPPTGAADTANPNYSYKGFIGFNLPTALTSITAPAADVVSAKVTAAQLAPIGTPYVMGTLKLQSITSADLADKFVDANKFLFYVAPFTSSFDFSTDGTVGPKSAVVTSAVVADLTNKVAYANRSLFRMIFPRRATTTTPPLLKNAGGQVIDLGPGDTDGDNSLDVAVFENAKLEVVYTQP